MYLIDTNVIRELRKGSKANQGVRAFFEYCIQEQTSLYVSVITIGELQRGIGVIRHRGDETQARLLETWLNQVLDQYKHCILPINLEVALTWGVFRVPHYQNAFDKLIAATAHHHQLIVVTRNQKDFEGMGIQILNPFTRDS